MTDLHFLVGSAKGESVNRGCVSPLDAREGRGRLQGSHSSLRGLALNSDIVTSQPIVASLSLSPHFSEGCDDLASWIGAWKIAATVKEDVRCRHCCDSCMHVCLFMCVSM